MADIKDIWDKVEILGKVSLPVVIAVASLWYNSQVGLRQENTEITKLAISILSERPAPRNEGADPLRAWALARLSENYRFSDKAQKELLSGELVLPRIGQRSLTSLPVSISDFMSTNPSRNDCMAYLTNDLIPYLESPSGSSDLLVESIIRSVGEKCRDIPIQ